MRRRAIFINLLLLFSMVFSATASEEILTIETFLATNGIHAGERFSAGVVVHIQDGWHINSDKPGDEFLIPTQLRISSSTEYQIERIVFPLHILKKLDFSDQPLAIFEGDAIIRFDGQIADSADSVIILQGTLYSQGCNDQVCLAPADVPFSLTIPVLPADQPVTFTNQKFFSEQAKPETGASASGFNIQDSLEKKGYLLTFILIFLGGLGLNLTPCVYPLIPVTMSYFGGQAVGKKSKTVRMAILYILGIAAVNSLLGTLAALSGGFLGTLMTNPFVLLAIAAILVFLSLSMFGVYEFGVPNFLLNLAGGSRAGYLGSLLMGLTMGIVAAPCIGPFVIGLLTYVAAVGKPMFGFLMFFTLSLGLGLPFLFLAIFSARIDRLPRSGEWMVGVRIIFGLLLIGMALYFIKPLLPTSIAGNILWLYAIGAGLYLILFNKSGSDAKGFVFIKKIVAVVAIMVGVWFLKADNARPAEMNWQTYSAQAFEIALQNNRPIVLDFYADWCIPCKELDKYSFSDPEVIRLSEQFELFKIDLTSGVSPEVKVLQDNYKIKGVPTIVFIARDGREIEDLRILGFEKADVIAARLRKISY
ncbi:MAG: cytochrome c biogenesis protein CcdA [Candidatus Neomarinimicrobiota bacterium]